MNGFISLRPNFAPSSPADRSGIFPVTATGDIYALRQFAYDLYTVANNLELPRPLVKRLRNRDQFQGARYELFVTAALLKAGYRIEVENERDGSTTHCELTATDKEEHAYSVEVKSRHRPGVLGFTGLSESGTQFDLGIRHLIVDALSKYARHERIVFIDVNLPDPPLLNDVNNWVRQFGKIVEECELLPNLPPAVIIATNQPHHFKGEEAARDDGACVIGLFKRPDLKKSSEGQQDTIRRYRELLRALNVLHSVPQFDGPLPRRRSQGSLLKYRPGLILPFQRRR